jgi:hypothetical protein
VQLSCVPANADLDHAGAIGGVIAAATYSLFVQGGGRSGSTGRTSAARKSRLTKEEGPHQVVWSTSVSALLGSLAWFDAYQQRHLKPLPIAVDILEAELAQPVKLRLEVQELV